MADEWDQFQAVAKPAENWDQFQAVPTEPASSDSGWDQFKSVATVAAPTGTESWTGTPSELDALSQMPKPIIASPVGRGAERALESVIPTSLGGVGRMAGEMAAGLVVPITGEDIQTAKNVGKVIQGAPIEETFQEKPFNQYDLEDWVAFGGTVGLQGLMAVPLFRGLRPEVKAEIASKIEPSAPEAAPRVETAEPQAETIPASPITEAAIKLPDGKVVTSTIHPNAELIAEDQGYTRSQIKAADSGFVDAQGNFLTRKQARDQAVAAKQIPQDYPKDYIEGYAVAPEMAAARKKYGKTAPEPNPLQPEPTTATITTRSPWVSTLWDELTPEQKAFAEDKYARETGDEGRFAKVADWYVNKDTGEVSPSTQEIFESTKNQTPDELSSRQAKTGQNDTTLREQPEPATVGGAGASEVTEGGSSASAEVKPTPVSTQKPSKIGQSIEAKAVEAKLTRGFSETAGYDPITIKDQADRAASLVKTFPTRARAIIRGEAPLPEGLRGTPLITALEEHLAKNPDPQLAYELANSPLTSATSAAAQEMRLMAERVPDSITSKFEEIKRARVEGARLRGETPETIARDITNEVVKNGSKRPTWEQFVNEIAC